MRPEPTHEAQCPTCQVWIGYCDSHQLFSCVCGEVFRPSGDDIKCRVYAEEAELVLEDVDFAIVIEKSPPYTYYGFKSQREMEAFLENVRRLRKLGREG